MSKFKTSLKIALPCIALCLTLAIAAPIMAKRGHHHQQHDGMRQILSTLSLTATQKQDVRQILKGNHEDQQVFSADEQAMQQALRSLLQSNQWDATSITSTLTQLHSFGQEKELRLASNKNQIWNTLTDTQQEKLVALLDARISEKGKKNSEGRHKGKGKIFKKLNLSTEQQTAIKTIKMAAKSSRNAVKTKITTYKQAERVLIQSTTFDADAWQTLSAKYQADFLTLAELKAKTKYDIWNLLTSKQQLKMAKRMDRMHKMGNINGHKHHWKDSV